MEKDKTENHRGKSMNLLTMEHVSKASTDRVLLDDVGFGINKNEKIGVIGVNGMGKSTLLKIVAGIEESDAGTISMGNQVKICYLPQTPVFEAGTTILRAATEGNYDELNRWTIEAEAKSMLNQLGFTDYAEKIEHMSGGQKKRVALVRALLTPADILVLDEPTNHLDNEMSEWLEEYLIQFRGAILMVTHDRYFLDRVVTKIIELDMGHCTVFSGNYSAYSDKKAMLRDAAIRAYLNQQQEIRHQEEVITKLKQFNREKSIKRAESREKMLSRIERLDKPTEVASEMRITLEPNVLSGEDVLTIEGLSKSFGDNNLFSGIDMDIKRGEHVALIGGNGTGKTTILKMINRLVSKDAGAIILGSRVKIGYYDQEHQVLTMSNTIFDEISDAYPDLSNTRIRNVLAAFLFTGEDVFKRIQDLSGGERGRVSLAKLMLSSANFLILDEPTNHLDITSKEILENAIRNYTGTVLYVSHDRYFINQTATRIIELRDKQLTSYIGNYDYYETHRTYSTDLVSPFTPISGVSDAPAQTAPAVSQAKLSWQESKAEAARQRKKANDLKKLEASIEELENRIAEIDEQFLLPENATNVGLLNDLTKQRNEADTELNELYTKWEELSEED